MPFNFDNLICANNYTINLFLIKHNDRVLSEMGIKPFHSYAFIHLADAFYPKSCVSLWTF